MGVDCSWVYRLCPDQPSGPNSPRPSQSPSSSGIANSHVGSKSPTSLHVNGKSIWPGHFFFEILYYLWHFWLKDTFISSDTVVQLQCKSRHNYVAVISITCMVTMVRYLLTIKICWCFFYDWCFYNCTFCSFLLFLLFMSPLRRHIFVCFMAKSAFMAFFSALAP